MRYCLTVMANPPKKIRGFEGAVEKAHAQRPVQGGGGSGGGAGGMHLSWTQAAGWAPKKGRQNTASKLTPTPCC